MSKRKYHDFIQEEQLDINESIREILILLKNINSRLEKCERGINYIVDSKLKEEQEKIEQKKHDEELYQYYIN